MASTVDSAFLKAARGEPVPHTPVWFMRQAGRSLPEYLRVREGIGMLESCMDPGLVVEITMQPVRRYGVDAAIFFSDIVLPLKAVGVDLDIVPGVGPVVARPVRTLADVEAIPDLAVEHERTRFARDLHDILGHSLTVITVGTIMGRRRYLSATQRPTTRRIVWAIR